MLYESEPAVRVSDHLKKGVSDSDAVEAAQREAARQGIRTLILDGKPWMLDRAIELRSHTRLIIDGVLVKLKNGVLDNVLRPAGFRLDPEDPNGYPLEIEMTEDISVLGRNGAALEGPDTGAIAYHPYRHEVLETLGDNWGWRGFLVYFSRCRRFELAGLTLRRTRCYAISMDRVSYGYLHDLRIQSVCLNGDGINLRVGTHHVLIENVEGTTSDDFIALNSIDSEGHFVHREDEYYLHPLSASNYLIDRGEPIEDRFIHDVVIRSCVSRTNHYSQGVAFLARSGHRIFNVWVDGLVDGNPVGLTKRIDLAGAYYVGYNDEAIRDEDLSDILLSNLTCTSARTAVLFRQHVTGLVLRNVHQLCPGGELLSAPPEDEIAVLGCETPAGGLRSDSAEWRLLNDEDVRRARTP